MLFTLCLLLFWAVATNCPQTSILLHLKAADLERLHEEFEREGGKLPPMNFGRADLKDGMFLKFEEFEEEEYFGHELPLMWMRVLNLPKVLRSFEVIWAIGTMFGETQRVDMITTRKNKFGRFQIAVLNPSVVPTKMDVVIGAQFFELQFEIEQYAHTQGTSQSMGRGDDGGGDNAQEDKEDARNGTNRGNMSMGGTSSAAQPFVSGSDKGKGNGMTEAMSLDDLEDDDLLDEEWEINDACLPSGSLAVSLGHHTQQLYGEDLVKENVVLQPSREAFCAAGALI
jgi:hypothetical protein